MTEIIIRNAVPTRAGLIPYIWDAARNDNSSPIVINGTNYYVWSDYNDTTVNNLVGETIQLEQDVMPFNRPYAYLDISELFTYGNLFYYGPYYGQVNDIFIVCKVRNNGKFNHILSYGSNYGGTLTPTNPMFWSGVSLSIFHDSSGNHTYIYCRVGRNYKTVRTNNFDFTTLHTFSIESNFSASVTFKWNNHTLCTMDQIINGTDGYTTYNCNMVDNYARYIQFGVGYIANFNLPFNSILQPEQNGVSQCYVIGYGKVTNDLMNMIYYRYNYNHVPLNINQIQSYTINDTLATVFGTTTNFSGNMKIL